MQPIIYNIHNKININMNMIYININSVKELFLATLMKQKKCSDANGSIIGFLFS